MGAQKYYFPPGAGQKGGPMYFANVCGQGKRQSFFLKYSIFLKSMSAETTTEDLSCADIFPDRGGGHFASLYGRLLWGSRTLARMDVWPKTISTNSNQNLNHSPN